MTKKRMSTAALKDKARRLQKQVAERIALLTGLTCGKDEDVESRPMGQTGVDIRLSPHALQLFPFSIECKNTEKWDLHGAIKQAKANKLPYTDWLVVLGRNNTDPIIAMDMEVFFQLLERANGTHKPVSRSLSR